MRGKQRHHSTETNFLCFKDDCKWKVKARNHFQFFLLSLNLKNMLTVITFGNKNRGIKFCSKLLGKISDSEEDRWQKQRELHILRNRKIIFKLNVLLGISMLLHRYYVLCWKSKFPIFYDFMASDSPAIQAYTDSNGKL